jgi:hypothetical protein
LLPLTGPLKGENAPIQPGQAPTKKVTAELEPLLPQWLREARKQARQSAQEEPTITGGEKHTKPLPEAPDLLAGLASQQKDEEEEDETPDWLTSITGAPPKKKKAEPESSQVKWVELGHNDEPITAPSAEESPALPWSATQSSEPERDELTEWFKQASGSAPASNEKLDFARAEPPAPNQPARTAPLPAVPKSSDVFKDLDAHTSEPFKGYVEPEPSRDVETPDWIKKLNTESPTIPPTIPPTVGQQIPQREDQAQAATGSTDVPDWLKSFGQEPAAPQQSAAGPSEVLPEWLKTTGPSSKEPFASQPAVEEPPAFQQQPEPEQQPDLTEIPDWITSLKSAGPQASEPDKPAVSAFQSDEPASLEPTAPASAFTESPDSNNDVDAIFASMQIPDWLSDVTVSKTPADENLPPAAQADELIAPAELPSWVQAMRPVESVMTDSTVGTVDTRLEERGALAGLQGVLPIIPGATAATSKPRSHSIKLDTTEQQQAHAALLEQILAVETAPIPMKTGSVPGSHRVLRWSLSALLFIFLGGIVFGRTQILPLPTGVPNETNSAIRVVEAIPAGAPVLVVFDYEPATVGEMEASGASLIDHMILLNHPRLTLLSTSPTGAALAERFMSSVLTNPFYKPLRGVDYIDLGYLPGGLAGVYGFAQNPVAVMPLSSDSTEAWNSQVLKGVTKLSDFASVIVLTDSMESGRVWIEQTTLARGNTSLIMISSAQAGPMFLPYVDSGQVNGLIAGLYGAAGAEQANSGQPIVTGAEQGDAFATGFVRRYWDAYSLGLILIVALMTLGGLWNFWRGVQDRRVHEAG